MLKILTSYKNGKYSNLFSSLVIQIRNSIQHQDYIINPKQPEITFYDRNKPPLTLELEKHDEIIWNSFFLSIAFDIAWFDMRLGIIEILLEEIDIVDEFFKKSDYEIVPVEGGLSILDLVLLIKTGKI